MASWNSCMSNGRLNDADKISRFDQGSRTVAQVIADGMTSEMQIKNNIMHIKNCSVT